MEINKKSTNKTVDIIINLLFDKTQVEESNSKTVFKLVSYLFSDIFKEILNRYNISLTSQILECVVRKLYRPVFDLQLKNILNEFKIDIADPDLLQKVKRCKSRALRLPIESTVTPEYYVWRYIYPKSLEDRSIDNIENLTFDMGEIFSTNDPLAIKQSAYQYKGELAIKRHLLYRQFNKIIENESKTGKANYGNLDIDYVNKKITKFYRRKFNIKLQSYPLYDMLKIKKLFINNPDALLYLSNPHMNELSNEQDTYFATLGHYHFLCLYCGLLKEIGLQKIYSINNGEYKFCKWLVFKAYPQLHLSAYYNVTNTKKTNQFCNDLLITKKKVVKIKPYDSTLQINLPYSDVLHKVLNFKIRCIISTYRELSQLPLNSLFINEKQKQTSIYSLDDINTVTPNHIDDLTDFFKGNHSFLCKYLKCTPNMLAKIQRETLKLFDCLKNKTMIDIQSFNKENMLNIIESIYILHKTSLKFLPKCCFSRDLYGKKALIKNIDSTDLNQSLYASHIIDVCILLKAIEKNTKLSVENIRKLNNSICSLILSCCGTTLSMTFSRCYYACEDIAKLKWMYPFFYNHKLISDSQFTEVY